MRENNDDYSNDGLYEMKRIGERILQSKIHSQKEIMEMFAEEEPKLKSKIDSLIKKICDNVLKCDPLQLLSYSQLMFLKSLFGITSEFQLMKTEDIAVARATEYIQSIFVSHKECKKSMIDDPSGLFFEISQDIGSLYQLISQYYLVFGANYNKAHTGEDSLLAEIIEAQLDFSVRGHRYQVFEQDYFRYLLEPHNDVFVRLFNLSAKEIVDGIGKLQYSLSQGRIDPFNGLLGMFEALGNEEDDSVEQITDSQIEKGQRLISVCFGTDLNDVCKITGWNKDFAKALSFGLGDCLDFFKSEDYSGWPIVDLPVQKKPFIEVDNKFYCFDYYSFSDNFYRSIQKTISHKEPEYNWSTVQQEASESAVADIFQKLLPGCIVYINNYYPKNQSLKHMCENDLIIEYYDVIIIAEVKAGSFVFTSPLLDFDHHIESYKNLIENPENQCQRTYDYLKSGSMVSLYRKDKSKKATIDMSTVTDVYMMSITVDNINTFAARAEKLSFIKSNCSAISIAIDDLMIYQDYFESPLVFLHFLKNRRRASRVKNLVPTDELDHLGMYISHNCYSMWFENEKANIITPVGYREDLDTYYTQRIHPQLKPEKPKQHIPDLFEKIIAYLDRSDCYNKYQVSTYFLDFSTESKESFESQVVQVIDHQKKTKRIQTIGTAARNKYGLRYSCFVSQPGIKSLPESEEHDYVWSNMLWNNEEDRVQINLAFDENQNITSVGAAFYKASDIPDDRRDELLFQGEQRAKDRFNRNVAVYGHRIGRNENCPCGSGKKYKKCCGKHQ